MMLLPSPNGWNPESTLNPSTHGMLKITTRTAQTTTLFLRFQPNSSILNTIRFSNTAMIVETAANVRNRKNRLPHKAPPLIFAKNIGQSDKDKAWTCIRLDSIGEACRNNDKSCCQRNKSIEYGDAYRLSGKASGFVQITSEDQHGTNTNG